HAGREPLLPNCLFNHLFPAFVFRYFSSFLAVSRSQHSRVYINSNGRLDLVEVTLPKLWVFSRCATSSDIPT
ncbi:MAG TPA: hypothetical protein PLB60_05850, partial [Candidatus Marinimicrobia bacterium]|nr:hypothetical protein [Candidatus Neomarinimicrobiota bacterium]